ncbi:hypothetical protein, partial [Klebsiella pneumoniae]|uniref:hypothetical protein n=1 Tax=Klebsiella pneumoniae TaxID=573 RepID=UPI001D0EE52C
GRTFSQSKKFAKIINTNMYPQAADSTAIKQSSYNIAQMKLLNFKENHLHSTNWQRFNILGPESPLVIQMGTQGCAVSNLDIR